MWYERAAHLDDGDSADKIANMYYKGKGVAVDKKTDFISMLSIYSSISGRFANKTIIPIVPTEEYSYSYFRAMKKSGITSYILYNENGEY